MTERTRQSDSPEAATSRYIVGIDLGTTNSAACYVDATEAPWQVRLLEIPQLVAPGQVERRSTLPSFHYQATDALRLPFVDDRQNYAVGVYARDQGAATPGRQIVSAKSWLCHTGVDRTADILPWQGAADVDRLSPVEVSARYLRHIRDAWNHAFPAAPLAEQQVVVTLPASFDEVARELTVRAAGEAGLPRIVLIEEPQAAFYAWVYRHADRWQSLVSAGQTILICDIGGGTSDFTLIRVGRDRHAASEATRDDAAPAPGNDQNEATFHRVAVGNHLILGGDNLDLALAHYVEKQLGEHGQLSAHQWDVLIRQARAAKETLLGADPPERLTLSLPGTGSRVIGGSLQVELTREEVQQLLVESFLPRVAVDDRPSRRQSGFQEFGLPYAVDPAITRYLAAFLAAHARTGAGEPESSATPAAVRPDLVLFNGGFFASPVLRQRLVEVLTSWFRDDDPNWTPTVLDHAELDLAVAYGAAYYGMTQRGEGVRIAANLARSYYVGVAEADRHEASAVCVVPGDAQPGEHYELTDQTFHLTLAEPVEFPIYTSSTRLTDRPGELIAIDPEQTRSLPPIRTVLKPTRKSQPEATAVHLHARLSEIGTIELWLREVDSPRTWRLEFDVRAATETDATLHDSHGEQRGLIEESTWLACREQIADVFSPEGNADPAALMKRLAETLDASRDTWPPTLLRRMWEALMELEAGSRRSAAHERRWLNLLGYSLRPGFGVALDDWRVDQTWRTVRGKLVHGSAVQALILWRRVAGGLAAGQQTAIADPALAAVRALHRRFSGGKQRTVEAHLNPAESVEVWRLLGSLELLPTSVKIEVGQIIVALLPKRKLQKVRDAMVWAVGRLGQRIPTYGPLNSVVPAEVASEWTHALLEQNIAAPIDALAAMQLARQTGDRHRDLAERDRTAAADWIAGRCDREHLAKLVREGGHLDAEEQDQVFGEKLPTGLRFA